MIRTMELLFNKSIHGENISRQKDTTEAALKRLFQKSQNMTKPLEIFSVHGKTIFNRRLVNSMPESANLTTLQRKLGDFRSMPCFDMLFYSYPQTPDNRIASFLEDLCYCRMLLKPGALLFLVTEGKSPQGVTAWFTGNKNRRVFWLRQAGFIKITTRKMGNGFILVGGQRPLQKF